MRGATEHACAECGVVVQLDWATAKWVCNDCLQHRDEDEHYVEATVSWAAAVRDDFEMEKARLQSRAG